VAVRPKSAIASRISLLRRTLMDSLANKLGINGWLSLNEFVKYLAESHPQHKISYPTALRMVNSGKLRVTTVGVTYRVYQAEVTRYLREGNYNPTQPSVVQPIVAPVIPSIPSFQTPDSSTAQAEQAKPVMSSKTLYPILQIPEDT